MKISRQKLIYSVLFTFFILYLFNGCAATRTAVKFYDPITTDLSFGRYEDASKKIDLAKTQNQYVEKDRVLYYLDKGIVLYYAGQHQQSNEYFDKAELAMEELFTKSISKAAASFILNDNVMDYFGEIYENIYINVFKALNYINMDQFNEAYVEIKRVNDKLRELDTKYGDMAREMNSAEDAHDNIKYISPNFYNNALANYLSYLVFRADREYDNSRISFEKMQEAFQTQPKVYDYQIPASLQSATLADGSDRFDQNSNILSILAFTGQAPFKRAVGGQITTYDDAIGIHGLEMPIALPNIYFPGVKSGYHFKFAFPALTVNPSKIAFVEVYVDGQKIGELEVLEKMDQIAKYTFDSRMTMVAVKTILRTVSKGLLAAEGKKKLKEKTGANAFWGTVLNAAADIAVDATENPDLRGWRTMPQTCYAGEFPITPGRHNVEIRFLQRDRIVVDKKVYPEFEVKNNINLVDAYSFN
ncbi:MAG: hypothetical protein JXR46_07060 [Calditrichaceae bacterium]|nr:hypothetical protein [Calditrichaceae bacterium]MBN2708789.1 hypothetical protein [Calditrichaceae bacterium]RQV97681.1 MAG: hypothetical protein EH224_01290 [Calditrichota bacterium]